MEYADYHHAMAQHAAALSNNNQLHPAMAQIPMLSAAGLNLTVMSGGLAQGQQHHLVQGHAGQHVMYQNVQQAQQVTHHQQQNQGHQNHGNHHAQTNSGGGGGHATQTTSHSNSKKNKKPKVNKDGVPAPKRATTAYINFTQWYREELKKAGRAIPKIGDFGKECAGKWNTMQEEEKKPFLEVAGRDRERYKREMQIYKPARDANKPKRPGTAFMIFMGDFRKEMAGKEPEGGVAALAKLGGERWRNMTEEDKRPYVEKQNVEKIRYEGAMEIYRKQSAAAGTAGPTKEPRLSTETGSEVASGAENGESDGDRSSSVGVDHLATQPDHLTQAVGAINSPSPPPSQSPNNVVHTIATSHALAYAQPFVAGQANNFYTQAQGGQAATPTQYVAGATPVANAYPGHYNWQ